MISLEEKTVEKAPKSGEIMGIYAPGRVPAIRALGSTIEKSHPRVAFSMVTQAKPAP